LTVNYHELVKQPDIIVKGIYDHFELPVSESFSKILTVETEKHRNYTSSHEYDLAEFGFEAAAVQEELLPILQKYGFEDAKGVAK